MIPISGTILSATLLPDEHFSLSMFIALLLVASGIGAVNRWQRNSR
jgi:hypothetical protein